MVAAEDTKPPEPLKPFFSSSFFESNFGENDQYGFTIGYKGWLNNWSLPVSFANDSNQPYQQDASVLFKSGTELASMPTLNFRYKNLYLTANYFSKTKYSFGTQKIDRTYQLPSGTAVRYGDTTYVPENSAAIAVKGPVEYSPSAERSEWDLSLGYYVNRHLALTVGYKQINRNYDYQARHPRVNLVNIKDSADSGYLGDFTENLYKDSQGNGMTIGITGNAPVALDNNLSLYGNFTYGWLKTEVTTARSVDGGPRKENSEPPESYTNPYYSGEVGFAYTLAKFKDVTLSSYLGYRFQRYEFRNFTAGGQTARDGTDGIILSFSAYF